MAFKRKHWSTGDQRWLRAYWRGAAIIHGIVDNPDAPPRKWSPEKFRGVMAHDPKTGRRITPPELLDRLRERFYDKDLPSPSTIYRWMEKKHDGPIAFLIPAVAIALGVSVTAITDPVRIRSKSRTAPRGTEESSGADPETATGRPKAAG